MRCDLLFHHVRVAVRTAVRRPGFTLLVVLTLALGLGVNSAVFALIDTLLLRPLPYPEPDRLVFLWQTLPQASVFELETTPAEYAAWHRTRSFSALGLVAGPHTFTVSGTGDAERVSGARITASVLPLLGIQPIVGRGFTSAEDDDAAPPVAILGNGLWRRRFGSDPAVVGRNVDIDGIPHTIIGILPRGALLPGRLADDSELWLPVRMTGDERANDTSHNYTAVGRLARGITLEQASSELAAFAAARAAAFPSTHEALGARATAIADDGVRAIQPALVVLLAGVALLLVIAAANVSTLLISRAARGRHDAAVRIALGAGRGELFGQAAAEMILLSIAAALSGLALGGILLRVFLPAFADSLPRISEIGLNGRIAGVTIALATVLGILFSGVVARQGNGQRLAENLRTGARTSRSGIASARGTLVASQIALAIVLLAGAGLMIRSVIRLAHVSAGFSPADVLTFRLPLDLPGYAQQTTRVQLVDRVLERLRVVPGASSAAVTSRIPFGGTRGANGIRIEGRTRAPGELWIVDQRHVSADYFKAMGIRLLQGRALTSVDDDRAEQVTVINHAMETRFWPAGDAIGQRVRLEGRFDGGHWIRIVGVVDDVRHVSLSTGPVPEMYRPYAQAPIADVVVVVKTVADPAAIAPACREVVRSVDPNLPIYDLRTMEERIAQSFAETRATGLLLTLTAALAAMLAALAIYGSVWYSVTQRTTEIGIRMALGATQTSVCVDIVRRVVLVTAAGASAGTAIALASRPMFKGLLFETSTADPMVYTLVIAAVFGLTLLACIAPARRAVSVDPTEALRSE